jgi:hypothetical protein
VYWPVRNFAIVQVALPDLGEGTKEATIKEWYVQPGSKVQEVSNSNFAIIHFV